MLRQLHPSRGEQAWELVHGEWRPRAATGPSSPAKPRTNAVREALAPFLPKGYPNSVTPDYAAFQTWDTCQALCSYVRGMLCQKAIMTGIGVGQEAASPLGALFHFFMRDFIGMLGGIAFAYTQGSGLDSHAKQWRLFADCINNIGAVACGYDNRGLGLELASPLVPEFFLVMACLGSIARSLCGVAAGATRAAMTQHFAKERNAADIAAKEGSQETATTLIGMVLGMAVTHFVAENLWYAWGIFALLTFLHVYFNIKAVRSLCLRSLNQARLDVLVREFVQTGQVLTPQEAKTKEALLAPGLCSLLKSASSCPVVAIHMGAPITRMLQQNAAAAFGPGSSGKLHLLFTQKRVTNVILHSKATADEILKSYVHAAAAAEIAAGGGAAQTHHHMSAEDWYDQNIDTFLQALTEKGWDLTRISIHCNEWRAEWPLGVAVDNKYTQ